MKKYVVAAPATLILAFCMSATADAQVSARKQYVDVRVAVVKKFGKRAPGRDIRNGLRTKHGVRPAKSADYRLVATRLRSMIHPVAVSRYLAPTAPYRLPAGTPTMRATADAAGGLLARIRQCESGGNYATNTGNGFYGAYQFTQQTWESVGGTGNPASASPAEQDRRAAMLMASSGRGNWPVCGA